MARGDSLQPEIHLHFPPAQVYNTGSVLTAAVSSVNKFQASLEHNACDSLWKTEFQLSLPQLSPYPISVEGLRKKENPQPLSAGGKGNKGVSPPGAELGNLPCAKDLVDTDSSICRLHKNVNLKTSLPLAC